MATLYELTGEFLQLMNMLEDEDCDEQCIMDTLESVEYEIEDKADGYAKIISYIRNTVDRLCDCRLQKSEGSCR